MFKIKIYASIIVIVVLGLLVLLHVYRNLGSVAGYLATLDNVSVPFSIAALEMEKNAGEYADGVLRYVREPVSEIRAEIGRDEKDFIERYAIYMRLATSDRAGGMGRDVRAQQKKLAAAGVELMDERDRLDSIFEKTTVLLEEIDTLIDAQDRAANRDQGSDRNDRLLALTNIEAETAEIGFWLTLFKYRPARPERQYLLKKVGEQHDALAQYRELISAAPDSQLHEALRERHLDVLANVRTLIAGETRISADARRFAQLAEHIDHIFDDQIQPMLTSNLSEPQEHADTAVEHVQATLGYLIPAYFLVALSVGIWLVLATNRPLKRLAAGTEAIGAGDLEHRIDIRGHDEFGKLAEQFNLMTERLQETTVSRDLLEASERELQQTVGNLRQEIVERKQAEREREALQAKLRRSETLATMGQLVAGVAHEVRNPLFGISSTLDAIEANAKLGQISPRFSGVLRREVNRLNKLMSALLEYGRTSPEDRTIEPLAKGLVEALHSCRAAADAANVALANRVSEDALVVMNYDRLLQVHVNLIENAVQHAPKGSEVIVSTRATTDEGGNRWIEYCVADSGPGLSVEDLPHLFDPFFTRRRGGTGLGLAIVRRIVDEHHGIIEPRDNPKGGTVMAVRLPVASKG
ncbi:ATP-binding protein [Mesorhizobium sp. LHD-90]|uniref:sensor histidine kinase n=1 Tax=Mesorhizobium sp. LHD-90 TaxID=3071414 RepID=UPI0027DFEED1|nr:ATP-binding protein [Mesorhizobium sp. LHD-90]MDQ6437466.1 ATP-binding protein [Mesorhizobium sp. LHD-90]